MEGSVDTLSDTFWAGCRVSQHVTTSSITTQNRNLKSRVLFSDISQPFNGHPTMTDLNFRTFTNGYGQTFDDAERLFSVLISEVEFNGVRPKDVKQIAVDLR